MPEEFRKSEDSMRLSPPSRWARRDYKRFLVIWLTASAALMVTEPFGTAFLSIQQRLVYWPILIGIALVLSGMIRVLMPSFGANHMLRDVVIGVAFALCFVPIIWVFTDVILGYAELNGAKMRELFFEITIFSIGVSVVREWIERRLKSRDEVVVKDVFEKPKLYSRFETSDGAQVVRLAANDHYVDVTLDNGKTERLLMRLRDAVAEIEPIEGFYTHRSHWVSNAFAVKGRRNGGRDFIELTDGSLVPVSRSYKPSLVEAGYEF